MSYSFNVTHVTHITSCIVHYVCVSTPGIRLVLLTSCPRNTLAK